MKYKRLKLKLRVFLAGHSVAMAKSGFNNTSKSEFLNVLETVLSHLKLIKRIRTEPLDFWNWVDRCCNSKVDPYFSYLIRKELNKRICGLRRRIAWRIRCHTLSNVVDCQYSWKEVDSPTDYLWLVKCHEIIGARFAEGPTLSRYHKFAIDSQFFLYCKRRI